MIIVHVCAFIVTTVTAVLALINQQHSRSLVNKNKVARTSTTGVRKMLNMNTVQFTVGLHIVKVNSTTLLTFVIENCHLRL